MEYINFIQDVCSQVQEELGDEYEVSHDCVMKNNSSTMDSMVIRTPADPIAPSIYLKTYYDRYLSGQSMSSIVKDVVDFYRCSKLPKGNISDIVSKIRNFEEVKDKLVVRMVNADMNEKLMEKCPYVRFLDFILTFHYMLDMSEPNDANIRITNEIFDGWNIELDELYEASVANTVRLLPAKVQPIASIVGGMLPDDMNGDSESANSIGGVNINDIPNLLVATNDCANFGAVCILYNGLLEEIANKLDSDLVILPSSVHEVIIYGLEDEEELPRYLNMVEEVNDTQLEVTDILSYNVYVYSKDNKNIRIYPADFMEK